MSIGSQVYALLKASAPLTAIVGADPQTRIWPNRIPDYPGLTFPALVFSVVSDTPVNTLEGASGLVNALVQVDVYSQTYDRGQEVADIIEDILGSVAGPPLASTRSSRRDGFEVETQLHSVSLTFSLWSSE